MFHLIIIYIYPIFKYILYLKFKNYIYKTYSFQKTKLCYNAVSKEIYCNVELVVIIIYPQLPDNPNAQIKVHILIHCIFNTHVFLINKLIFILLFFMKILSNTINELSSKFVELSLSMENNLKSIKYINNIFTICIIIKCIF